MIDLEKVIAYIALFYVLCLITKKLGQATQDHPLFTGLNFLALIGFIGCIGWFVYGVGQRLFEAAVR